MTIPINKIQLNPGSLITLNDLTWEQFEAFLEEKEAKGIRTRIAYIQGTLAIMSPLPANELEFRPGPSRSKESQPRKFLY